MFDVVVAEPAESALGVMGLNVYFSTSFSEPTFIQSSGSLSEVFATRLRETEFSDEPARILCRTLFRLRFKNHQWHVVDGR